MARQRVASATRAMAAAFVAVALVGVAATPAIAQAGGPGPVIGVAPYVTQLGATTKVSLAHWPGQLVVVSICGDLAHRGSQDCDQVDSVGIVISPTGEGSGLVTVAPPIGCPCVIRATTPDNALVRTAPVVVKGMATLAPGALYPDLSTTTVPAAGTTDATDTDGSSGHGARWMLLAALAVAGGVVVLLVARRRRRRPPPGSPEPSTGIGVPPPALGPDVAPPAVNGTSVVNGAAAVNGASAVNGAAALMARNPTVPPSAPTPAGAAPGMSVAMLELVSRRLVEYQPSLPFARPDNQPSLPFGEPVFATVDLRDGGGWSVNGAALSDDDSANTLLDELYEMFAGSTIPASSGQEQP
jgi:hypothetical protein